MLRRIVRSLWGDPEAQQPDPWKSPHRERFMEMCLDATIETTEALEHKDEDQQAELVELQAECAELRAKLAELRAERAELRAELAELRSFRECYQDQIAQLRCDINEQRKELSVYRTQRVSMEEKFATLQDRGEYLISKMEEDIKDLQRMCTPPHMPTRPAPGSASSSTIVYMTTTAQRPQNSTPPPAQGAALLPACQRWKHPLDAQAAQVAAAPAAAPTSAPLPCPLSASCSPNNMCPACQRWQHQLDANGRWQPRQVAAAPAAATTSAPVVCGVLQVPVPPSCAGPAYMGLVRNNTYHHIRRFDVGERAEHVDVYMPSRHPLRDDLNPSAEQEALVVLYVSSTHNEAAPIDDFHGSETVYAPKFKNHGSTGAFKNKIPPWLCDWIAKKQLQGQRWFLFGCSRGAAWGAQVAVHPALHFEQVCLIAPYTPSDIKKQDPSGIKKKDLLEKLKEYKKKLTIVYGSDDHWLKTDPDELMSELAADCNFIMLPGKDHDASMKEARAKWLSLIASRDVPNTM